MDRKETQFPVPSHPWVIPALLFVQVLFGVNYVVSKYIVGQIPALVWASIRIALAALVMGSVSFVFRRELHPKLSFDYLKPIMIFAVFGVVLNQGSFLLGLSKTTATNSAILNSLIPIFTLLIVTLRGKEKLTGGKAAGFVSALIGVLVLKKIERFSFDAGTWVGDALTVFNCLCFAFFLSISKEFMQVNDRLWATTYLFVFGAIGMGAISIPSWIGFHWPVLTPIFWSCVVYGVVGATVMTYFLNNWTLAHTKSSNVALYIYLQPAIAALVGWLWFGEMVTIREFFASGLIFIGVLLGLQKR